ncbi:RNA polymerase sigma factor [Pelagibacterium halotolerans]|uniref:RNA polymerase sigma factor n=1 Tax=Pelagibacterium halotolerans TaxID=531813 RepID=UPI00384A7B8C
MYIDPLRKCKESGELYTRRANIIDFICKSLDWPFDEFLRRAEIKDRRHSDYVPSEVLVYHLRQTKSDNSDGRFVALYDILRDRVEAACPRPNRHVDDKVYEDSRIAEIRDATIDHVTELMFTDRQGYDEQLDIYEVVFDKAVRSARITKLRKVNRRETATEEVEDTITGEVRTVVEAALDRYKKTGLTAEEDFDYRIHLRRAIDALPTDEREVIDLLLADIPIETSKDGEPSMTELLGCVEKTVRNRRDRAYAKIRRALDLEIDDGE